MKAVVVSATVVAVVALACSPQARADDPPALASMPPSDVVSTLDHNGNGCVDLEEGRNYASRRFHALDRNRDGSLDAEEAPLREGEAADSRPVSINDWQDAYHARFGSVDTDNSGCLSVQEIEAGRAAQEVADMKRHRIHLLAGAVLLLLAGQAAAADTTIVCESQNDAYQSCPVDTSGGVHLSRQLSRQGCWQNDTWGYDRNRVWVTRGCRAEFRVGDRRSGNDNGAKVAGALVLGTIAAIAIAKHNDDKRRDRYDDDRYDHRYDDGYDYGYGDGYYGGGANWGREFTCSSKDNRMTWCGQQVGRSEHVEVRRQLSNTPCIYGRTWGVDRRQVWTDQGCRAVFVVY